MISKKNRKRLFLSGLITSFLLLSACKNNTEVIILTSDTPVITSEETIPVETPSEEIIEEPIDPIDYDSYDYNTDDMNIVIADNKTPIYDVDNNIIGYQVPDRYFMYLDENDTNYLINYYGEIGYVNKNDTHVDSKKIINTEIISKGYITEDTPIYYDYNLQEQYDTLNKLEFIEIYKELDNCYLIQTIDTAGFIPKTDVVKLDGNLAVVDLSNQELRVYEGNNMVISAPVVTGTKDSTDRHSDEGLFQVHNKGANFDIIPNTHVDVATFYNDGEGIHDAYWRSKKDFGGDTYITNGSHGCINTPHDEAVETYKLLNIGDKVLVKK